MRYLSVNKVYASHEVTVATSALPNQTSDSYYGRALVWALANPARIATLGVAGRAAWRQRFNWEALPQEYLGLFQRVCAGSVE